MAQGQLGQLAQVGAQIRARRRKWRVVPRVAGAAGTGTTGARARAADDQAGATYNDWSGCVE